jgi:hypothetical protein
MGLPRKTAAPLSFGAARARRGKGSTARTWNASYAGDGQSFTRQFSGGPVGQPLANEKLSVYYKSAG